MKTCTVRLVRRCAPVRFPYAGGYGRCRQVAVRCHFDVQGNSIADYVEANVERWEGVITKVLKDTAYIKFDAPVKGIAKVTFDSGTQFNYCAGDALKRDCGLDDLKIGRHLETVGFVLGKNELRATRVLGIQNRDLEDAAAQTTNNQ